MNEKIYDALDTGGERILLHWTTYEPGVVPGNPKWEIPVCRYFPQEIWIFLARDHNGQERAVNTMLSIDYRKVEFGIVRIESKRSRLLFTRKSSNPGTVNMNQYIGENWIGTSHVSSHSRHSRWPCAPWFFFSQAVDLLEVFVQKIRLLI